ncbi:ABC transporter ATP-binding protein [Chitinibacter tainanensis]|uniref:ABC transporter ATP-binding protein n=1 Tax=Chitinibacter tainanensis TaxID=230667 RepID=UPI0003F6369A|nr:ABC transporter ATP-binding protein [Chitinibacter tainanensis]
MSILQIRQLNKRYRLDDISVPALTDIQLDIQPNRFTVLSGPSGSGKTTLLNLIGALDRPTSGEIILNGQPLSRLNDDQLADFRARQIGFIFQNFNLLPVLSAYENVEYPLILAKVPPQVRRNRVMELLAAVGLADKAQHRPGQLSGGQRQRVAIARALATNAQWILADEPTANLDQATGAAIIALMRQMQHDLQVSFIFSSHDPQVLAAADEAVFIRDGRIVESRTLASQTHPERAYA